jgi:hypothetical protein
VFLRRSDFCIISSPTFGANIADTHAKVHKYVIYRTEGLNNIHRLRGDELTVIWPFYEQERSYRTRNKEPIHPTCHCWRRMEIGRDPRGIPLHSRPQSHHKQSKCNTHIFILLIILKCKTAAPWTNISPKYGRL